MSIAGANSLGKLLALKTSKNLSETIKIISKSVLPESMTADIIDILGVAKAPKRMDTAMNSKTVADHLQMQV